MNADRLLDVIKSGVSDIIDNPGKGRGQDYSGLSYQNRMTLVGVNAKKIRDSVRNAVGQEVEDRRIKENVLRLCEDALSTDGGHHKQWYLDQIVRALMSEGDYQEWRNDMTCNADGEEVDAYDEGIAP